MDKVQVTKEQMDILNTYVNTHGKDGTIDMHKYWCGAADCLNELKYSDIAKVLYTEDYEIKSEFEIGDYVFCTNKEKQKSIGKITNITGFNEDVYVVKFEDIGLIERFMANRLRNATEEEIEQEKERRIEKKLDKLILDLNNEERVILQRKLNGEN